MRFPRYWAKGQTTRGRNLRHPHSDRPLDQFYCWGWSEISVDDARRRGSERADAVVERFLSGEAPNRYGYGDDRPFREPLLEEMKDGDGSRLAVVSRNSYGSLVLNTTDVMFVDVDLRTRPEGLLKSLRRLFGGGGPTPREQAESAALDRLRRAASLDSSMGVRVYRTHSGLRYLMTHRSIDPTAEVSLQFMAELGADPLYIRLCQTQACYRARMTPKPWRCGVPALNVSYPWREAEDVAAVGRWVERYEAASAGYATCSLVEEIGSSPIDPDILRVVEFHDRTTGVGSRQPLA